MPLVILSQGIQIQSPYSCSSHVGHRKIVEQFPFRPYAFGIAPETYRNTGGVLPQIPDSLSYAVLYGCRKTGIVTVGYCIVLPYAICKAFAYDGQAEFSYIVIFEF